jgi:CobQ-like glutamine amidotransferase family enzyme
MSETREHDSQSDPMPNDSRFISDMVIEDMAKRAEFGLRKYGTKLQAHNGRDALQDAYEEVLDLCVYLKQRLVEDASK